MIHLGYKNFNINYKYLNNKSIKLINQYYNYDFKLFNYSIIYK